MRVLLATLLLTTAAFAADEARTINFTDPMTDPTTGEAITECTKDSDPDPITKVVKCVERKPLSLGVIAYRALLKPKERASLTETAARWRLQQRVLKGPQALSGGDVSLLTSAINDFGFSTEIAGQAICKIDPTYCTEK